jgi:hypothetical protein
MPPPSWICGNSKNSSCVGPIWVIFDVEHAMTRNDCIHLILVAFACLHFFFPDTAMATQAHGAPEGILAHQMAHVFFIFSMGILIYWLRERELVVEKAWRNIQYAALFFILWNLDTILAHLLDEQLRLVQVTRKGLWTIHIATGHSPRWLGWVYFFLKLDHLLCVPALAFLLVGLRRLVRSENLDIGRGNPV